MKLKDKLAGKFIVLDGPDGSGKGTQLKLLADALDAEGVPLVLGKDPGGTETGERIRAVLLRHDLTGMDPRCEALLFMASRAQLVAEVIAPALEAGKTVLCDRFISSTCAYQGAAGADGAEIIALGRFAVGSTWPDLTLIVDVPVEEGFRRTGRRPHHAGRHRARNHDPAQGLLLNDVAPDAMEARPIDFHRKVREMFLHLPADYPGRIEVIDGLGSPETVHQRIREALARVDF